MTTIAAICDKCGNTLITAEWSEYVSDGLILNFWSCAKCGYGFETEAFMPVDSESKIDGTVMEVSPFVV